jgi:hypothetical protein
VRGGYAPGDEAIERPNPPAKHAHEFHRFAPHVHPNLYASRKTYSRYESPLVELKRCRCRF